MSLFFILYMNALLAEGNALLQPWRAVHSQKNPAMFYLWTDALAEPNSEMVNRSRRLLVMGGWTEDVHLLLIFSLGG